MCEPAVARRPQMVPSTHGVLLNYRNSYPARLAEMILRCPWIRVLPWTGDVVAVPPPGEQSAVTVD